MFSPKSLSKFIWSIAKLYRLKFICILLWKIPISYSWSDLGTVPVKREITIVERCVPSHSGTHWQPPGARPPWAPGWGAQVGKVACPKTAHVKWPEILITLSSSKIPSFWISGCSIHQMIFWSALLFSMSNLEYDNFRMPEWEHRRKIHSVKIKVVQKCHFSLVKDSFRMKRRHLPNV